MRGQPNGAVIGTAVGNAIGAVVVAVAVAVYVGAGPLGVEIGIAGAAVALALAYWRELDPLVVLDAALAALVG